MFWGVPVKSHAAAAAAQRLDILQQTTFPTARPASHPFFYRIPPATHPPRPQPPDISTPNHTIHLRLPHPLRVQASTPYLTSKYNCQVLFIVHVVLVQVQEHLGARGGGDTCAHDAFDMWEAVEEARQFGAGGGGEGGVDWLGFREVIVIVVRGVEAGGEAGSGGRSEGGRKKVVRERWSGRPGRGVVVVSP